MLGSLSVSENQMETAKEHEVEAERKQMILGTIPMMMVLDSPYQ